MKKITCGDSATLSEDRISRNIRELKRLFPETVAQESVDFDTLRALLGDRVDDSAEKYGLYWRGKGRARRLALTPSTGTLRPCPEESVEWDATRNILIEGDNLEVLKLLQKSYARTVKLIYIDPPYNTGKDFVYSDNYRDNLRNYLALTGQLTGTEKTSSNIETNGRYHTNWLTMMYPRLHLSRSLLANDGLLFVSIDDHEHHNLRCICDEIFGDDAFVGTLTWVTTTQPDNIGRARYGLQQNIEYVLVYSRCPRTELPPFRIKSNGAESRYPHRGKHGKCRFEIIERAFEGAYARPTMRFKILGQSPRPGKQWQIGLKKARELERTDRVEIVDGVVKRAVYPGDDDGKRGFVPFWAHLKAVKTAQAGKAELTTLMPNHGINTVKPISLITEILTHLPTDALVLDFFSGSGTTACAVMEMNRRDGGTRRSISVQLPLPVSEDVSTQRSTAEFCASIGRPRNLAEITKERIRRVGSKLGTGSSVDAGFRVFKLDGSNIRSWEPNRENLEKSIFDRTEVIKRDRTAEDLHYELILKLGYDLCAPTEVRLVAEKTVRSVDGGRLFTCLDGQLSYEEAGAVADGIVDWRKELGNPADSTVFFRDDAFTDDVGKVNCAELLKQRGILDLRCL